MGSFATGNAMAQTEQLEKQKANSSTRYIAVVIVRHTGKSPAHVIFIHNAHSTLKDKRTMNTHPTCDNGWRTYQVEPQATDQKLIFLVLA